jgi:hypothetical protein
MRIATLPTSPEKSALPVGRFARVRLAIGSEYVGYGRTALAGVVAVLSIYVPHPTQESEKQTGVATHKAERGDVVP